MVTGNSKRGTGVSIANILRKRNEAELENPGGGGGGGRVETKKPSLEEVWIFFGTIHLACGGITIYNCQVLYASTMHSAAIFISKSSAPIYTSKFKDEKEYKLLA